MDADQGQTLSQYFYRISSVLKVVGPIGTRSPYGGVPWDNMSLSILYIYPERFLSPPQTFPPITHRFPPHQFFPVAFPQPRT